MSARLRAELQPHSAQVKRRVDIASAILTMAIAALMILLSWKYVGQSYAIAEKSPDPGGIPMRWLIKAMLPLGFGLLFLQALGGLLRLCFINSTDDSPESHRAKS